MLKYLLANFDDCCQSQIYFHLMRINHLKHMCTAHVHVSLRYSEFDYKSERLNTGYRYNVHVDTCTCVMSKNAT